MTLDMHSRIRPADWWAVVRSLPADSKPVRLIWQLALSFQQFVNVRINRELREMLDVMFSDVCDRSKDL